MTDSKESKPVSSTYPKQAEEDSEDRQQVLQRFRVRYARVVIMETIVEALDENDVCDDGTLPSVYKGMSSDAIPSHVESIVDYDAIWEVEEDVD